MSLKNCVGVFQTHKIHFVQSFDFLCVGVFCLCSPVRHFGRRDESGFTTSFSLFSPLFCFSR